MTRLARAASASLDPSSYRLMLSALRPDLIAPAGEAPKEVAAASDEDLLAAGADGAIPRIIFQTWKSKTEIPANYAYLRSTFLRHNPSHTILLWDDDDNRAFIARHFPWFLPQYESYPREIFRADIVRPFFLFRYGGFYADMDTECLRPLDGARFSGDVVLGRMGRDRRFEHAIPNAIMAARPFQAFWLVVIALAIERFVKRAATDGPERLTGPILLRDAVLFAEERPAEAANLARLHIPEDMRAQARQGQMHLLAPDQFYPVNWNNPAHQIFRRNLLARRMVLAPERAAALFPSSAVVTYWSHSW